jgi:tetrapyrrole methylase family protein/MazG family protein
VRNKRTVKRAPDLGRLQAIMARLREPEGCPWDRRQTLESMRPHLLEEAYEVLDVMAGDDADAHCEELGDLLFQVVFQARLREEAGSFDLAAVVRGISEKLERRHPHVFGDEKIEDASEVVDRWETLKRAEGKGTLDGVPRALPALTRAEKVGRRAARSGFDWSDIEGPLSKVEEELKEVREAMTDGDRRAIARELGDLLFAVVNVARHLDVSPELALVEATDRFVSRYRQVEARLRDAGETVEDSTEDTLNDLWEAAKRQEETGSGGGV